MSKAPIYKDTIYFYNPDYFDEISVQKVIEKFYIKNDLSIEEYPELSKQICHYIFEYCDTQKTVNTDCMGKVIYHTYSKNSDPYTDCYLLLVFNQSFILPWTYTGLMN
jgi:hypothetical protein